MDVWMIIQLIGGLGLFLYGMKLMAESLEKTAGNKLRRGLEVLTTNRFAGAGVGFGVTALIQSSSATTVMVVGFVNAGLMTLMQASGVMMGACVGTTVTAWIISFDLKDLAPLFVFAGVVMMFFFKKRNVKRIGGIILGFGVLFVGMDLMSEAMKPLREMASFQNFLISFQTPLIGIMIGVLVTMIIQSSSATIGILVGLAMVGAITLDSAVFVILGANIGTSITAILASIGASKLAKRAAVTHLLFHIVGVIIFAPIVYFLPVVDWISAAVPKVEMQIAVFHTLFNVSSLLLMIWYPQLLINISKLIIRGEDEMKSQKRFQYIGDKLLDTPSIAVGQCIKEVARMAEIAKENYEVSMEALLELNEIKAEKVFEQEQIVNFLNHEITSFMAKLSALELSSNDALITADLFHIVNDLERISDHAENIAEYTMTRIDNKIPFTDEAIGEIKEMHAQVMAALEDCVMAFANNDKALADEVIRIEKIVDQFEWDLKQNHVERIAKGRCTAAAGMIFTDLITNLERVSDHATNIAYYVTQSDYR
ncbi:MAG: Na/Pi cotransporter family protein [Eubacteriales bacterium]|nr:Na/Pi cotransporter family protein [Eubacteriales bacterium]